MAVTRQLARQTKTPDAQTQHWRRPPPSRSYAYRPSNCQRTTSALRLLAKPDGASSGSELEACRTAPPERQLHLMRSATHLAATACWPAQARMIRKQAEMRFPNTAGKPAWPTPETTDYCEGIKDQPGRRGDCRGATDNRIQRRHSNPGSLATARRRSHDCTARSEVQN